MDAPKTMAGWDTGKLHAVPSMSNLHHSIYKIYKCLDDMCLDFDQVTPAIGASTIGSEADSSDRDMTAGSVGSDAVPGNPDKRT